MKNKSLVIKDFSWKNVEIIMQLTSYSNNKQLAILLYDVLKCPQVNKKTPRSTDKKTLPLLKLIHQ